MRETIQARYQQEAMAADSVLDVARECSALTDPVILPEENQQANERLPEPYTSIGRKAVTTMKGKLAAAMYPPDKPWFLLALPAHIANDPNADQEVLREATRRLMLTEISAQAVMESAGVAAKDQRRPGGFASQKLASIAQLIVTGDTLERIGGDYRVHVYRRDQYITRRDDACDVLYHITRQKIDPFKLTKDEFAKSGLDYGDLAKQTPNERMRDLYTLCEWEPQKKRWIVQQEINEQVIRSSEEAVSPFVSTAWRLGPGEHYGRGLVEEYLPSLRTLNKLEKRRLDILGVISKITPVIDHGSMTKDRDLAQESGVPIRGRVEGGAVQDVAFLGFGNIAEHRSLVEGILQHEQAIKEGFLMLGPSVRDSERTTAFEVSKNASEINEALGGIYIPLTEQQHIPTLRRVLFQMRKDGKFASILPEDLTEIRSLTGLSEIVRNEKARSLLETTQIASLLGPEALEQINTGALFDALMRYRGVYVPGVVRSDEEVANRRAAQAALETQQAGQQAAINVAQTAGEQLATQAIGAA